MILRRRDFLMASATAIAACTSSRVEPPRPPTPLQPGEDTRAPKAPAPLAEQVHVGRFSMHSGMWMNLHHFIYALAAEGEHVIAQVARLRPQVEALDDDERMLWDTSVQVYRQTLSDEDLLFDPPLGSIKAALAEHEHATKPELGEEHSHVGQALQRVATSYRARIWPEHLARARRWRAEVRPLVDQHGPSIVASLEDLFRTTWPAAPMRVDLCMTAKWGGAYTSLGPTHVVLAVDDTRNQGSHALEVLFHEASHAVIRPLRDALEAECRAQGTKEPPQLWHAILFYTSGRVVAERIDGHVPYAEREGLWANAWPTYRGVLERFWEPYVAGESRFEDALTAVVRALKTSPARRRGPLALNRCTGSETRGTCGDSRTDGRQRQARRTSGDSGAAGSGPDQGANMRTSP